METNEGRGANEGIGGPLSASERRFVEAYVGEARGDAVRAALLAGTDIPEHDGWRFLRRAAVAAEISARLRAEAMLPDEVMAELTAIARAPWQQFLRVRVNGQGEPIDARLALGEKLRALELLARCHGMLAHRVEVEGDVIVRRYVGVPVEAV